MLGHENLRVYTVSIDIASDRRETRANRPRQTEITEAVGVLVPSRRRDGVQITVSIHVSQAARGSPVTALNRMTGEADRRKAVTWLQSLHG